MQPWAWHRVQSGKEEYPALRRLSARFPLWQNSKDITQMRAGHKKGTQKWLLGEMVPWHSFHSSTALQRCRDKSEEGISVLWGYFRTACQCPAAAGACSHLSRKTHFLILFVSSTGKGRTLCSNSQLQIHSGPLTAVCRSWEKKYGAKSNDGRQNARYRNDLV